MRTTFFLAILILCSYMAVAQTEIIRDGQGTKIIKGFMNRQDLANDTAFSWFAQNQQGYTPEQNAVQAFKSKRGK